MKSTFKRKVPLHARYKLYLIKTNLKACTEWMSYQLTCKRCWDAKSFSFIRENCSFTAPKQDKMADDEGNSGCKKPNYLIVATSRRQVQSTQKIVRPSRVLQEKTTIGKAIEFSFYPTEMGHMHLWLIGSLSLHFRLKFLHSCNSKQQACTWDKNWHQCMMLPFLNRRIIHLIV